MYPSESAGALERFLRDQGIALDLAPLERIVEAFLDFYATVPALGLNPDLQSDNLLFEYGVYDWGEGELFDLDITRQFTPEDYPDDASFSQLHCTTKYQPTPELRAIAPLNRWCENRDGLAEFSEFIRSTPGYQAALRHRPAGREIWWDQV